jgi:hypothetical protein
MRRPRPRHRSHLHRRRDHQSPRPAGRATATAAGAAPGKSRHASGCCAARAAGPPQADPLPNVEVPTPRTFREIAPRFSGPHPPGWVVPGVRPGRRRRCPVLVAATAVTAHDGRRTTDAPILQPGAAARIHAKRRATHARIASIHAGARDTREVQPPHKRCCVASMRATATTARTNPSARGRPPSAPSRNRKGRGAGARSSRGGDDTTPLATRCARLERAATSSTGGGDR